MKKLLSLLIVISLFCANVCVIASEGETVAIFESSEGEFLKTLGIPNIELLDKGKLTRGEFTTLVVSLFYPDDVFSVAYAENIFEDVDERHDYFNYIKAAKDLGIISGRADAYFNPDEFISYQDALVILINALGYKLYATAEAEYPTGYITLAKRIGLTNGVNSEINLSNINASKLLYNALFVDEVSISGITNGSVEIEKVPFSNLLSSKYNITKYDALVINTPFVSLDGSEKASLDMVVLKTFSGNFKYAVYSNNSNIENEAGKRVVAYVKNNVDTGKSEIVHYKVHNNVETISISSDKIIDVVPNQYIEYEITYGKSEKLSLSDYPYIIYNGSLQSVWNKSLFIPEDGVITFIDNDGNGSLDVVNILSCNYSYKDAYGYIVQTNSAWNIVVDKVDLENEFITCKWNPRNNIELEKDKAVYSIISNDDNINTLADIKADDIVSVAKSPETVDGKNYYILAVSRKSISDILLAYNQNENVVTIGDSDYYVSSSIYKIRTNYLNALSMSKDITAKISYSGKIAYMGNLQASTNNYAYLISAKPVNNGQGYVVVKVLEKTGAIKEYKLSGKVKIDGVSCKDKSIDETYKMLVKRPENYGKWIKNVNVENDSSDDELYEDNIGRPIILKVNGDELVTSVDTDNANYTPLTPQDMGNSAYVPNTYATANAIGYCDEEVFDASVLKAGYRSPRVSSFKSAGSTVDGKFFVTSDTYVFKVPEVDTCGFNDYAKYMANPSTNTPDYSIIKEFELEKEDENYKVVSSSEIYDGLAYDIQGYNIDPDTGIAEMVVLRGRDAVKIESDYSSLMCAFLRITEYYDANKEKNCQKIYYTQDGVKEESAIVDSDSMLYAYDYVINGRTADGKDKRTGELKRNIYNVDIPELKKGDLLRISVSNGYISHLERVYIIRDLENTNSSISTPRKSSSYIKDTYTDRRLFDVNNSWAGNSSTINIFSVKANDIKGNIVSSFMGLKLNNSISFADPATYTEQYFDISGLKPILITIKGDGSVEVSSGSISDIITVKDKGNLSGVSTLIYKHARFKLNQLIIVNDERV